MNSQIHLLNNNIFNNLTQNSQQPDRIFGSITGAVLDKIYNKSGILSDKGVSLLFYNQNLTKNTTPIKDNLSNSKNPRDQENSIFDNLEGLTPVPFSLGPGSSREKLKEDSVGKWYLNTTNMPRMFNDKTKNPDSLNPSQKSHIWTDFESVSKAEMRLKLPDELKRLVDEKKNVKLILMVSDKNPNQVLELLDIHFPYTTKYGVIGSQTPFLNGRDFTLFKDLNVNSEGLYGIAFCEDTKNPSFLLNNDIRVKTSYPGYKVISEPAKITKCRGNMILEINSEPAVKWLKSNIDKVLSDIKGPKKDLEFYLKVVNTHENITDDDLQDANISYKITGGDPSRGGISVGTINEFSDGQIVQIIHSPPKMVHLDGHNDTADIPNCSISFQVAPEEEFDSKKSEPTNEHITETDDNNNKTEANTSFKFGGASHHGFFYGNPQTHTKQKEKYNNIVGQVSTDCSVPNAISYLK
ncbi:hypothetical protein BB558_005030 [Smittium angustum]|uniref:Uncharacterized protein n=1 Tax=Smittium angustum TaxID=133377 RepID=A0A2U1J1K1_SMIAN|nr:hypothetical protein BB558_005030 [Smittium angustum]